MTATNPESAGPPARRLWQQLICPAGKAFCNCSERCAHTGAPIPARGDPLAPAAWRNWLNPALVQMGQTLASHCKELTAANINTAELFQVSRQLNPKHVLIYTQDPEVRYWSAALRLLPRFITSQGPQPWQEAVTEAFHQILDPVRPDIVKLGFTLRPPAFSYTLGAEEQPPTRWQAAILLEPAESAGNHALLQLMQTVKDNAENRPTPEPDPELEAEREADQKDPFYQLLQEGPGPNPHFQMALNYAEACLALAWRISQGAAPPGKPGLEPLEARSADQYCRLAVTTAIDAMRAWYFTYTGFSPFASDYNHATTPLWDAGDRVSDCSPAFRRKIAEAIRQYDQDREARSVGRRVLVEEESRHAAIQAERAAAAQAGQQPLPTEQSQP